MNNLALPRPLDLSLDEDRALLRLAADTSPDLAMLIDEQLDDYLQLFPEAHWKRIHSGGILSVPIPGGARGTTLQQMLETTRTLKRLQVYSGFDLLLSGFRNGTQVEATLYEVTVAEWCATRLVTTGMEFSPPVRVKDKVKRPEFLWRTTLGDVYAECKSANTFSNSLGRRFTTLYERLGAVHRDNGPWPDQYRLDVSITGPARQSVEVAIKDLTMRAAGAVRQDGLDNVTVADAGVEMTIRRREVPRPAVVNALSSMSIVATTEPTRLSDENAQFSITMSTVPHLVKAVGHLLREARSQLPLDTPGVAFIQIGGGDAVLQKVQALLALPEYHNVAWVSLWWNEQMRAVYHVNQPFDDRLLLPVNSSQSKEYYHDIQGLL